jgi:hypothetical protein
VSLNIKSEILCGDFSLMFYKNNNGWFIFIGN